VLGYIHARHHFESRYQARDDIHRGIGNFPQQTILAEADPAMLLVGFEVDIRDPVVNGVHKDLIDIADNGGVVDVRLRVVPLRLFLGSDVQAVQVGIQAIQHSPIPDHSRLLDRSGALYFFDEDHVRGQARGESDLVQGPVVLRIRDAEKEPIAALEDRQGAVLTHQLFIDQVQGEIGKIDGIQIQQGYPDSSAAARAIRSLFSCASATK